MEQSIKDLIKEINILDIKPNQALCVKFDMNIDVDKLCELRQHLMEELGCKVIMLTSNTELSVINVEEND